MRLGDGGRGTGGRGVVLLLALCGVASGADLGQRIQAVLDASAVAKGAFWGIEAVDAASGTPVFELNQDRFFVPASNTKLFTTGLALTRLGPDYRFQTRVVSDGPPDGNGRVRGLRLIGGGDPNLSPRAIPYTKDPVTGDPLRAIEDLAAQVVAHGVRAVDGPITGDDTAYVWEPYVPGWAVDDPLWEYGAPVSALAIDDNAFQLVIAPGAREGDLARLTVAPALDYYQIDNRVRTVEAGRPRAIELDREPYGRQLRLWGSIPLGDDGDSELLGISDPALYGALALRDALERRGVTVRGDAVARHLYPNQVADLENGPAPPPAGGFELARRESAPLAEDLRITDKISQNLHADMALRAVARARRGVGSREAGLAEMRQFLTEAGLPDGSWNLNDGSGLARLNLVTPAAVVRLLRYMYASPARETWLGLLPVGGQDGTLGNRFQALAGRIHAKTGSLSHVTALSGYAERPDGSVRVFSILVNNFNGTGSEVRDAVDKICSLLAE